MKRVVLIIAVIVVAAYGLWVVLTDEEAPETASSTDLQDVSPADLAIEERFVALFYEAELENTEAITEPPVITGNEAADERIRELAERRGYRLQLRVSDADELVDIDGVLLQPGAARAWEKLLEAALDEDIVITSVGGYVSVDVQREIFLEELDRRARDRIGRGYTPAQIAGGTADAVINGVLRKYAIPGYEKRHSGYIVSIAGEAGVVEAFAGSVEQKRLHDEDYAILRTYGFVPAYPEIVASQGPDLRSWEYAWVGAELVRSIE